jgi:hypothetical protein
MPKAKRTRRPRAPREKTEPPPIPPPVPPLIPPLLLWWLRSLLPGLPGLGRGRPLPRFRRSQEHLRNAAIEVLEGMRACLDETLEWLREERHPEELKKIKVE